MSSLIKTDMDDDIESLLKELELEQDTIPSSQKSYKKNSYNISTDILKYNNDSKKKGSSQNNTITDDLNDILQELSVIDSPSIPNNKLNIKSNNISKSDENNYITIGKSSHVTTSISNTFNTDLSIKNSNHEYSSSQHKAKCTTVCIGGLEGITIGNNQKSCSKLRCTSCDFNCIYFNDYEWTNNVDYLFFRNHVPNTEKLLQELKPKKGYTSICCQCSWITVNKTIPISFIKNKKIKWVCGGHYI